MSRFCSYISFVFLCLVLVLSGCSTKKDKALNKFWHRLNTRFNGHFNGREAIKIGMQELAISKKDNYLVIIPVFEHGDRKNWQNMNAYADRAIEKAVTMIKKHSMLINGKQHNTWIDDCYLLLGKANFYKVEHMSAIGQLRYVVTDSEKNSTKNEARIWMAKTYNEMGEYPDASTVIRQIDKDALSKNLKSDYYAVLADYYIRTGFYEEAIKALEDAVYYTKVKRLKARYSFIQAQLYQQIKNDEKAYDLFSQTLSYKPEYEVEFQAKINMARTGSKNNDDNLRKVLKKMLKDDKNIDYEDQIYYALGLVELRNNKKNEGIDYLKKSLAASKGNQTQRAISYLELAELYLNDKSYVLAQAYYDSTATIIDETNPRYAEIIALRDNLGEVVENIYTVELQDSLQRLAKLSDEQLDDFLAEYVEKLKKQDEENKLKQDQAPTFTPDNPTQKGDWYFINKQALAFGVSGFKKVWGDRPLEDNWRRKNKNSTGGFTDNTTAGDPSNPDNPEDNPRYNPELYKEDIPRTDSMLLASNQKIYDALYDLGMVYKDKINDQPRAIEAFEELIKRNTNNRHFPLTYYQLYLIYTTQKNTSAADKYRQIILSQYPTSEYAKILGDPNYLANKEREDNRVEPVYQQAYNLYKAGDFSGAYQACQQAITEFKGTSQVHRFALLAALCLKNTTSVDSFIVALENVKAVYDSTESAETATRLLAMLKKETKTTDTKVDTVKKAPESPFKFDSNAEHIIVIYIPDAGKNLEDTKTKINAFNDKNFSLLALSSDNVLMPKGGQLLTIRKFKNVTIVMNYLLGFKTAKMPEQIGVSPDKQIFPMTLANYSIFFKNPDVDVYKKFLDDYYKNVK